MESPATDDPLIARYSSEQQKLNRRSREASETSLEIARRRTEFFDKLAVLNAGALTFSVTLFSEVTRHSAHWIVLLHLAWGCLLIALGACLVRNLSHQHYQFAQAATRKAESEVVVIDADSAIISARTVVYRDSGEPFDVEREVAINKSNRDTWVKEVTEQGDVETRHWRIVRYGEWIAAVSMFLGFVLLVGFAVSNS